MSAQPRSVALGLVVFGLVTASCGREAARLLDAGLNAMIDGGGSDAGAQASGGIDSRSGSRLTMRRIAYTGADGSRYDTGATEITDTQLGVVCSFSGSNLNDGTYRCVPPSNLTYIADYYADAACSMHLATSTSPCVTAPSSYVWQYDATACSGASPYVIRLFHVGAAHTGGVYSKSGTGPCTAVASPPAGWSYYLRGAEAPPSDFVQMMQVP